MAELLFKASPREFEVLCQPEYVYYSLFTEDKILPYDYIIFRKYDRERKRFTGLKVRRQVESVTLKKLFEDHPERTYLKLFPSKVEIY